MTDLDALIQEAREWDLRRGSFLIVGKLADALETLRAERDAALAREAALRKAASAVLPTLRCDHWLRIDHESGAVEFVPSYVYVTPSGAVADLEAVLASSPPAAEPETSDDPLMVIADHMCDSSARSEPEAVENG